MEKKKKQHNGVNTFMHASEDNMRKNKNADEKTRQKRQNKKQKKKKAEEAKKEKEEKKGENRQRGKRAKNGEKMRQKKSKKGTKRVFRQTYMHVSEDNMQKNKKTCRRYSVLKKCSKVPSGSFFLHASLAKI